MSYPIYLFSPSQQCLYMLCPLTDRFGSIKQTENNTVAVLVGGAFLDRAYILCMYGHTSSKSMDQPGKVASPARGQLNRENIIFPVRVRA